MANKNTDDVAVRLKLEKGRQFEKGANNAGKSLRGVGKDAKKTSRDLGVATRASLRLRTGMLSLGLSARNGVALGFAAGTAEVVRATKGYADHMAVVRRTNAVIVSTGGAANATSDHVGRLSDALERQTGMDGDLIQSGANLLLTFTNVRNGVGKSNQVFDQATATITGMSQALGQDTKASAIQLGKALNDPIKGVTSLSKVGVSFTADQKKQIATLVKTGKTMDAQKMILRELNKEFPKVNATPFERMMVTVHALEDDLGSVFLPLSNKVFHSLTKLGDAIEPAVGSVADDINHIFARGDIDVGKKFALSMRSVRHNLGPFATDFEQGLKNAGIDQKLEDAITWAIPRITSGARVAGINTAEAFGKAFLKADPLGQLLIGGYLLKKLGAGGVLAKGLGGLLSGKGKGGGVASIFSSRGSTPANPLFVAVVNGGAGGLPVPGKGKGKPGFVKNAAKFGLLAGADIGALGAAAVGGTQAVVTGKVPGWVPLIGGKDLTDPIIGGKKKTATAPADPNSWLTHLPALTNKPQRDKTNVFKSDLGNDPFTIVTPITLTVDGKVLTEVVNRHNTNKGRGR